MRVTENRWQLIDGKIKNASPPVGRGTISGKRESSMTRRELT
jgi:hypothetical protein